MELLVCYILLILNASYALVNSRNNHGGGLWLDHLKPCFSK